MILRFSKGILAFILIVAFNSFITPHQASSQTAINSDDSLTVATPDSLSLSDTLPTFSNLGHFCSPIRGKVISHFGPRRKRFHAGTDIYLHLGDSVRAAFSGVVTKAQKYYGYGLLVVLKHNNEIETYYSHFSKILVKVGDTIPVGKVVGLGGRTGRATCTHLHFEFRINKIAYNSELLFDFGKQLVLRDSIPAKDTIQAKDTLLLSKTKTSIKDTTLAKNAIQPRDSISNNSSIAKTEQVKQEEIFHTIIKNDTLYSLSRHYKTTVKSICALNNIKPTITLRIGRKLKIQ